MFEILVSLFNVVLYKPLFNALIFLYTYIPGNDFGVAIIILTIIIRFLLYPLSVKAINSQKALQKLQPKIQEMQKKYKDDKEKQAKEMLVIYKTEKINPFSGFILTIIQLPILIALYTVFWHGLDPKELINLYGFMPNPEHINSLFLNLIDLSKPHIFFAILAGIIQYFQTKMLLPKAVSSSDKTNAINNMMQKQMTYFFPFLTIIILFSLPSALGLYWTISGIFSIIQQYSILKKKDA
jgi:YidC/Oxa1 family membrane protein insertase